MRPRPQRRGEDGVTLVRGAEAQLQCGRALRDAEKGSWTPVIASNGTLQCGRALRDAEKCSGKNGGAGPRYASMRPRPQRRGEIPLTLHDVHRERPASMRPRPQRRGETRTTG